MREFAVSPRESAGSPPPPPAPCETPV